MAGTEHTGRLEQGGRPERRRFITRHNVEDAAASGQPVRVQARDVVTDEAAQRARDLGVRIERERAAGTASGSSSTTPSPSAPSGAPTQAQAPVARAAADADLRRAVRAAVVAELGVEPPGLDAVIDNVLKSRQQ
jgi:hypothetical protein